MNKFLLSGYVGTDPSLSGTVAKFSICNTEYKKNANGEWDKIPEWFNCTAFGNIANRVMSNVRKGDYVNIFGKIHNWKYTGKDGQEKSGQDVIIESIETPMIQKKENSPAKQRPEKQNQQYGQPDFVEMDNVPY